ncbi:MAG: HEAT repeat domain-containing protein [Sandaracinaceae bacterium]|nr:HEAT repeat domain-containing protein [Sandaracinaceae bacterium]
MRRLAPLGLALLALLSLGFEWEGRLTRLRRELRSDDPARRREGRAAPLRATPAAEVREPLLAALEDPDAGVRAEAAQAVGRVRLAEAVPRLLDWLDDPEADVRAAPRARSAASARSARSEPRARARRQPRRRPPRAVWAALAAIGTDEVIVPILGRLDDVEAEVRVDAAAHLGHLGDPRAAVPLVGRARDDAPEVRAAVHAALGDLGDLRAVPALDAGAAGRRARAAPGRHRGARAARRRGVGAAARRAARHRARPRGPRAITAALGAIPGAEARGAWWRRSRRAPRA